MLIADEDTCYLQALNQYLMTNNDIDLSIYTFSEWTLIQDFLQKHTMDILLITPTLMTHMKDSLPTTCIILLHEGQIPSELNHLPSVKKYQSAPNLIKEVINILTDHHPDVYFTPRTTHQTEIIGVYSPIGGCGKSSVAIGLGKASSLNNVKTLLMNLEDFSYYKNIFNDTASQDMSDLLYYAKQKNDHLHLKVNGIVNKDIESEMDYIYTSHCCAAYEDMTNEDWDFLLFNLRNKTDYSRIIIDCSSDFGKMNRALLPLCDSILLITNPQMISQIKIEEFYRTLKLMELETLNSKLIPVLNHRVMDEVDTGQEFDGMIPKYSLPYDSSLNNCISINSMFGQAVAGIEARIFMREGYTIGSDLN